jgi:hypothetical protein
MRRDARAEVEKINGWLHATAFPFFRTPAKTAPLNAGGPTCFKWSKHQAETKISTQANISVKFVVLKSY